MGKRRAYELSKELGIDVKELVLYAQKAGVAIKNHMSNIDDEQMEKIVLFIERVKRESRVEKRVGGRIIRRRAVKPKFLEKVDEVQLEEPEEEELPAEAAPESEKAAPVEESPVSEEVAEDSATEEPRDDDGEATDTESLDGTEEEMGAEADESPDETPDEAEAEKAGTEEDAESEEPKRKPRKTRQISKIIKHIDLEEVRAPVRRPPPRGDSPRMGRGPSRPQTPSEIIQPVFDSSPYRKGKSDAYAEADGTDGRRRKKKGARRREVIDESYLDRRGKGSRKRRREMTPQKTQITTPKASKRVIRMATDSIIVAELAKRMGIKANEIILKLIQLGLQVSLNQAIDQDTATIVASEFGYEVESVAFEEEQYFSHEDPEETLKDRSPVVTVMGHVDHGKTSILDAIRKTNVADGEAGGITQHIGAYIVRRPSGNITFIDTPGHEAFTSMRARGANVTDIVILVVAADDGVMPQTIEAINHSKAAEAPIIVAVNKVDKPGSDPTRVRRELMNYGLVPEDLGGEHIMVDVSAKTGQGIDSLLEMVLLQAEILELKANPAREQAESVVLEGRLDRGRGPVATLLVRHGTIKVGDFFVCGSQAGKIKAMLDDRGERITEALPADPVEVLGFHEVPDAGEIFNTLADEKQAKTIAENRHRKKREKELAKTTKVSLEELAERAKAGELKTLSLVIKGDVQGSVEALRDALVKLSAEEVKIDIVSTGVGGITESDVLLASASNAIVLGFNVRAETKAQSLAEAEGVELKSYNIIYDVLEDIRSTMLGLAAPKFREDIIGHVEIRDTFVIPKVGTIAGSYVLDGKIMRSDSIRLYRDNVVIYTGRVGSLRRFKEDVAEVQSGYECGLSIDGYNDIKVGDLVEVYKNVELAPTLS